MWDLGEAEQMGFMFLLGLLKLRIQGNPGVGWRVWGGGGTGAPIGVGGVVRRKRYMPPRMAKVASIFFLPLDPAFEVAVGALVYVELGRAGKYEAVSLYIWIRTDYT
jgi:hypothetical protein